ncbi:MAG: DNA alkylation repair protein [Limnohabitans sp.]|nr:DNA alkylation repair protein [Limnohabitans sp.]
MATDLKHMLSLDAAHQLCELLAAAGATVHRGQWQKAMGPDFEALGLMDRGRRLAQVMATCLPPDFARAAPLLVRAMGRPMGLDKHGEPTASGDVPSSFFYLPHSMYIASHGLHHLPEALHAQHALTQRFTAEFSLRPFLQQHPDATLAHLALWATRPRLPWAARLPDFVRDPTPVLPLLARLRDDPSAYVRRSVANHLNDIGKDHPELLTGTARQWLDDAPVPATRQSLLRHALRTAIKRGDVQALALFGHGQVSPLQIHSASISPSTARIGESVTLRCQLHNPTAQAASALADWRVFYVKANGTLSPKVFKGSTVQVEAHSSVVIEKTLSLRQMSTRTHHPGRHTVEIALNGHAHPIGHFDLHP